MDAIPAPVPSSALAAQHSGPVVDTSRQIHKAALNWDVLLLVMSFCDKQTTARLMCTCPTLLREGAKLLLTSHVSIRDQNSFVSFIHFVKAHKLPILFRIRSLHLAFGTIHPNLAIILGRILAYSINLQVLCISHTNDLFASHPIVHVVLCKLRSLRHLTLHRCGKLTLMGFKPPLIALKVTYITPESFFDSLDDMEGPLHHPMLLCAPLQTSLEALEIQYHRRYGAVIWQSPYVFAKTKWLILHDNAPYTVPYATSFPNLTHLTIYTTHQQQGSDQDAGFEEFRDSHHYLNQTAQTAHGTWSRLEHLTGDVYGLCLLAPACPVGRITVAPIDNDAHLLALFLVLEDLTPTVLDLTLPIALLTITHSWVEVFSHLSSHPIADSLSSLTLAVSVGPLGAVDGEEFDVTTAMCGLVDSLDGFDVLRTLTIQLYPLSRPDFSPIPAPAGSPPTSIPAAAAVAPFDPPLSATEASLAAFDSREFAMKLGYAVPGLQRADISVVRPRSSALETVVLKRNEGNAAR